MNRQSDGRGVAERVGKGSNSPGDSGVQCISAGSSEYDDLSFTSFWARTHAVTGNDPFPITPSSAASSTSATTSQPSVPNSGGGSSGGVAVVRKRVVPKGRIITSVNPTHSLSAPSSSVSGNVSASSTPPPLHGSIAEGESDGERLSGGGDERYDASEEESVSGSSLSGLDSLSIDEQKEKEKVKRGVLSANVKETAKELLLARSDYNLLENSQK